MSTAFDYEQEDKAMAEWLEAQARDESADYDEDDDIRREEMREEMEYYKQAQQDMADDAARMRMLASTCPMCGKDCGDADYDPPDESVGIRVGVYVNECETHGLFYTYDDGTQDMES